MDILSRVWLSPSSVIAYLGLCLTAAHVLGDQDFEFTQDPEAEPLDDGRLRIHFALSVGEFELIVPKGEWRWKGMN